MTDASESRKEYKRLWEQQNREKRKQKAREWYLANIEKRKDYVKQWYLNNKDKAKEQQVRFRNKRPWYNTAFGSRVTPFMPPWADRNRLEEIYKEAYEKGLEVDHIQPLRGDGFCGLHVEYNLQLLTKQENMKKGNKLE